MSTKKKMNVSNFEQLLNVKYGKRGSKKREVWQRDFETFLIGVVIEEARELRGLTQEELAMKCGTNKSYISRIENNASDIRLSTLMKIIHTGLGGRLQLVLD